MIRDGAAPGTVPSPDSRALVLLVRVPDNPGALAELEAALRDGGLDSLREALSWAARVAESAIEVEVRRVGRMETGPNEVTSKGGIQ